MLSDTHGAHRVQPIPDGDLLIHAGDITRFGELDELEDFDDFLASLPHPHKLVIAGNHDWCFQRQPEAARARLRHATYLEDEALTIDGWHVYASPWQPAFDDWAFNLPRGEPLREKWARIPSDTDLLITHAPPFGHGDRVALDGQHVGCEDLLRAVERIAPRLHVFGHIHEGAGVTRAGATTFVNAASCDVFYEATQPPTVTDLTP